MKPSLLSHPGPLETFDERDTVFARTRLVFGTERYESYYAERPETKDADDRTRSLPPLASPGTRGYRAAEGVLVEALFEASDLIAAASEESEGAMSVPDGLGAPHQEQREPPPHPPAPEVLTRFAKEAAGFLGADDVGIAMLEPAFVYARRGRPLSRFGEPVSLSHRFAVVLVFAMRKAFLATSPRMASTAETARVYQQAAAASFSLARAFQRLGIASRAHVDSNYLVLCPPLAEAAGLGEVGRNGILIHRTLGPGVRLGVVTISAGLIPDEARCFGIAAFCQACGKCRDNCPAGAIPAGGPAVARGALKWSMNPQYCYHYWRTQGTDCGVCVRTCPFDKPATLIHKLVRATIRRTTLFNRLLVRADDLVYGASPPPSSSTFSDLEKQRQDDA